MKAKAEIMDRTRFQRKSKALVRGQMALEGRGVGRKTGPIKAERKFELEGEMVRISFLKTRVKERGGNIKRL